MRTTQQWLGLQQNEMRKTTIAIAITKQESQRGFNLWSLEWPLGFPHVARKRSSILNPTLLGVMGNCFANFNKCEW
jgi:hypothetical protein